MTCSCRSTSTVTAGTEDRAGARVEPEVSEETDLNVDDMLIGIKQLANKVENESHKVQRILRKVDSYTGRHSDNKNEDDGEHEDAVDDEEINVEVNNEVTEEDDDYNANDEAFTDTMIVSAVDKAGQLKVQEGNSEPLVFEEDDDGPNSGENTVRISCSLHIVPPPYLRDLHKCKCYSFSLAFVFSGKWFI